MFKHYIDLNDVVSLLAYCPSERSYLLTKEISGEYWIPSYKTEKNCWKMTAQKICFELFGVDSAQCLPLRVYKIWLPNHPLTSVYHAVYKVVVKSEVKKRTKLKNVRNRLQWLTTVELDRQRAHSGLRSPEVMVFTQMAIGDLSKDNDDTEMESGMLVEICEDNIIVASDVAGGAVALASPHYQLLQAANYNKDDQIRMYREFLVMVYPALYMSPYIFAQFMFELGWQRAQCPSLFRAADLNARGGISFMELMLWTAALEPATRHSGVPAELRCRYIFRYFDSNRDLKLEYVEFKELVAAARATRQLSVDALSVARDADVCLRQLGIEPNSQLPLSEFLRGVGEFRLRGTSSLLRAPRSISGYLVDLQEREHLDLSHTAASKVVPLPTPNALANVLGEGSRSSEVAGSATRKGAVLPRPDYNVANYTVRLHRKAPNEMLELTDFDEDAVSASTARLMTGLGVANSLDVLGPSTAPVEALAAIHYFATAIDKPTHRRGSSGSSVAKPAWSWLTGSECNSLGAHILRMAEAVRELCANEPRLLRLTSPVYVVGDLHGNLAALLAMESALWPSGTAVSPARLLFLGDYVDRGPHGTELLAYLFAAKLQRPQAVLLVRGNHETRDIQKMFTFHTECVTKYGETEGVRIWTAINEVFDVLPLAAVVDDKVFCCHGGIPPPWVCPLISAIDKVPVPLPKPAEQSSIAWELLWNDPIKTNKITASVALELSANEGFARNWRRGTGHVFEQTALDRFLRANRLSHVVRAHELHHAGFMCELRGRLVSVFSSSHYCGGTNDSGIAMLDGGKLRLLRLNGDY